MASFHQYLYNLIVWHLFRFHVPSMQLGESFSLLGIKDYPYAGCVLTWRSVSRDSDRYFASISYN